MFLYLYGWDYIIASFGVKYQLYVPKTTRYRAHQRLQKKVLERFPLQHKVKLHTCEYSNITSHSISFLRRIPNIRLGQFGLCHLFGNDKGLYLVVFLTWDIVHVVHHDTFGQCSQSSGT